MAIALIVVRARLKYLLDQWGLERFLSAVESEIGRTLWRVPASRYELPQHEDRFAHIGFHKQKQTGKCYVGVVLP